VAKQRKAIVDGLRSSIVAFDDEVAGSSTNDIITLLLVTQYFDTIRDVGSGTSRYVSTRGFFVEISFLWFTIHLF